MPAPPAADDYLSATKAPFARGGDALFTRSVARLGGPAGTTVEIRDVILGPHRDGSLGAFKGPLLIDLRSGEGSLTFADRAAKLTPEQPVSVPAGTTPMLHNSGSVPLVLRLYLVEGS